MGIESNTIGKVSDTMTTNDEGNKESTTDKEDNQKTNEGMPGEENGEESKKDIIDKEDSKENKEGMEAEQDIEESKEVKREIKEDGVAVKEDDDKGGNQTFETKKEGEDKDVTTSTIKDEVLTSGEIANNKFIALMLPVAVGKEPNKSISDQQRDEETSILLQVDKPEEHSKPQVNISEDETAAPLQESGKETTTPKIKEGLQEKTADLPKITIEITAINPIPNTEVEQTNDMTTTTTSVDQEIVKETSNISIGSTQKEDTRSQEATKATDVGLDISFDTILDSILKSGDIKEDKSNPKTTPDEEKEVQVVYL